MLRQVLGTWLLARHKPGGRFLVGRVEPLPMLAVFCLIGTAWYVAVPPLVRIRHPRLDDRNPDHFAKMVRFHRTWGIAAVAVGLVTAWLL